MPRFSSPATPLTLAVLVLLTACATRPPAPAIAVPDRPARVVLDYRPHSQWNDARRAKVRDAARLMESVLNQPAFIEAINRRRDLQRTEGLAAADIVQLLRGGLTLPQARAGDTATRDIVLALAISPAEGEFSRDPGFTDLDTLIIYLRRDWLDKQPLCAVAGLLAHERMHVMGFMHADFNHPWRRRSVPYAVGDLVAEHAQPGCVMKDG